MAKPRRELTPDERAAAERFRSLLVRSGKTQDQVAEEIGVTQGAVWQWVEGKVAISAKRAAAAAAAVGGRPEDISIAWREVADQSRMGQEKVSYAPAAPGGHNSRQGGVKTAQPLSQPLRLDVGKLRQAIKFARTFLIEMGRVPDVEGNAELVAAAYEVLTEPSDGVSDQVAFFAKMMARLRGAYGELERQAGGGSG